MTYFHLTLKFSFKGHLNHTNIMNCLERYNQLVLMILRSLDMGPQYPFLIPSLDAWSQKRVLLKKLLTAPAYEMGNCATPSNCTPYALCK